MGFVPSKGLVSNTTGSSTCTTTPNNGVDQRPLRGWLVVDFDGTCSIRDTTPLLPRLACALQNRNDLLEERMATFRILEEEFVTLYNKAKQTICSKQMSLDEALDVLDQASNIVTAKVSASGILHGLQSVSPEEMRTFLRDDNTDQSIRDHAQLLPECISVLSRAQQCHWNVGILSINWCPSLIHAVVLHSLVEEQQQQQQQLKDGTLTTHQKLSCSTIPVWSNVIKDHGVVDLHVPGALAKKERILKLQNKNNDFSNGASVLVVYVGDSSTDLAALRAADIGILIGGSQSTIDVAQKFGITIFPLKDYNTSIDSAVAKGAIWTTDNWKHIGEFLEQQSMV